jgi:NADH-quinone oxidoreductase subunit J
MDVAVFAVAALIVVAGALGVVLSTNPVHSALMLVMTLFGVAVLFVAQDAHFLAAVQVIVYAGAIVVLFLFVIMLLGVDKVEDIRVDPLGGQRPVAAVVAVGSLGLIVLLAVRSAGVTGARSVTETVSGDDPNLEVLGRVLFTDYLLAFEATSALLVIAVVGAITLARRPQRPLTDDELEAREAEVTR